MYAAYTTGRLYDGCGIRRTHAPVAEEHCSFVYQARPRSLSLRRQCSRSRAPNPSRHRIPSQPPSSHTITTPSNPPPPNSNLHKSSKNIP